MVKVVLISDTHTQHNKVTIPDGDILIHSGDFSMRGTVAETKSFLNWYNSIPHPHKIFISGNHDLLRETNKALFKTLTDEYPDLIYLHETSVQLCGLNIYGSPFTPEFCNWAFNVRRGHAIKKHWDNIPEDTDVLVTHGPPHMILDKVVRDNFNAGCEELLKRVKKLPNLKLHVFGHIHEAYGSTHVSKTLYVNASLLNASYNLVNKPVIWEI